MQEGTGQKMDGQVTMQKVQAESKEAGKKTNSLMYGSGGRYAIEIEDELPPLANLKFVDEQGQFTDKKRVTEEEVSYFWRKQLKTVSVFAIISALGILIIMLGATSRYTNALWDWAIQAIFIFIDFLIGLLPL
jgi:hypothetical protein